MELVFVMNEEKRYLVKLLATLLQYPDEEFIRVLGELKEAVEEIPQAEQRERCRNFLDYLCNRPLISLQEEYTATFDLNPSTCLDLTYHRWGDGRERGTALVAFHHLYQSSGYESTTGDLPDYLPLVLEFVSVNRQKSQTLLGQYCEQVETIGSRLQENGSPYAGVFENVVEIFRELQANGA